MRTLVCPSLILAIKCVFCHQFWIPSTPTDPPSLVHYSTPYTPNDRKAPRIHTFLSAELSTAVQFRAVCVFCACQNMLEIRTAFRTHSIYSIYTLCLTWQLTFRSLWMNFLSKIKQPFDFSQDFSCSFGP